MVVDQISLPRDPWVLKMQEPKFHGSTSSRITSSVLLAAVLTDPRVVRFFADFGLQSQLRVLTSWRPKSWGDSYTGPRRRFTPEARAVINDAFRQLSEGDADIGPLDVLWSLCRIKTPATHKMLEPVRPVLTCLSYGQLTFYRQLPINQVRVLVRRVK
jgi:hypothetical protein